MSRQHPTITYDRALQLLGSNVSVEQTAAALGVTPSAISQLLADPAFAKQVEDIRYEKLQAHVERDESYDAIEDKLRNKFEKAIPLLMKPKDILHALNTIANIKRRGGNSQGIGASTGTVVNVILPTQITQQFVTNSNNQVVKAGNQDLVTMASGNLLEHSEKILLENTQEAIINERPEQEEVRYSGVNKTAEDKEDFSGESEETRALLNDLGFL